MITANDPAGMGIAFTNAINRYSSHKCRLITTEVRYNFDFQKDLHIPDLKSKDFDNLENILKSSDIFHFHILSDENIRVGPFLVKDYIKGKKILHHHHGHPFFKENVTDFLEKYKKLNREVIVSTPDLLKLVPTSTWLPNIVPINDPLYLPSKEKKFNEKIRIGHSPTRKDLKRTDIFEDVMSNIVDENDNVEKIVISNTLHVKCLEIKKSLDIFFDQIGPSFGVSSLEALSQGVPSIARLNSFNTGKIDEFTGCNTNPWINVNDGVTLERSIKKLINDEDLLKHKKSESRKYMEKYWKEEIVLDQLFRVYNEVNK